MARHWLLVGCIMHDELPDIDDPCFFSWPGCASLIGIFLAVIRIALGVFYRLQEYTEGLPLVIIFTLAGLLVVVSTRAR